MCGVYIITPDVKALLHDCLTVWTHTYKTPIYQLVNSLHVKQTHTSPSAGRRRKHHMMWSEKLCVCMCVCVERERSKVKGQVPANNCNKNQECAIVEVGPARVQTAHCGDHSLESPSVAALTWNRGGTLIFCSNNPPLLCHSGCGLDFQQR